MRAGELRFATSRPKRVSAERVMNEVLHKRTGEVLLRVASGTQQEGNKTDAPSLTGLDLSEALLAEADLRGADLRGACLWRANLRGADLRGADLRGAVLWGAILYGADLTGIRSDAHTRWPYDFDPPPPSP
jgi:hypothetical protein